MHLAHLLKRLPRTLGIAVAAALGHLVWAAAVVLFVVLRAVAGWFWKAFGDDLAFDLAWPHVEALRRCLGLPTIEQSRRRRNRLRDGEDH